MPAVSITYCNPPSICDKLTSGFFDLATVDKIQQLVRQQQPVRYA